MAPPESTTYTHPAPYQRDSGDREVLHGAQRLHAEVRAPGNLAVAELVAFGARRQHWPRRAHTERPVGQQRDACGGSLADTCHDAVIGLRVLLSDEIHCLAGDHPHARAGAGAPAGEVRGIAQHRALGDQRSLAEGVEEVFIAVRAANDLDLTLLDDARPLVRRRFVKQPFPRLPFAQPRPHRDPAQILRVGAERVGRRGDGTFEHRHRWSPSTHLSAGMSSTYPCGRNITAAPRRGARLARSTHGRAEGARTSITRTFASSQPGDTQFGFDERFEPGRQSRVFVVWMSTGGRGVVEQALQQPQV